MTNTLIDNKYSGATKIALDGLAARQQAVSRNIANVDTPGYRAQTISFEKAVKNAMGKAEDTLRLNRTSTAHLAAPNEALLALYNEFRPGGSYRADGNNVDIDVEMIDMNETVMRYQTVVQMMNKRYKLIREISAAS